MAGDASLWFNVESKLTPPGYFGSEFSFLQCSRGPNEVLESVADAIDTSQDFWYFSTFLMAMLVVGQFVCLLRSRRGEGGLNETENSYQHVCTTLHSSLDLGESASCRQDPRHVDSSDASNEGNYEGMLENDFEDEHTRDEDMMVNTSQRSSSRWIQVFVFLALNLGVAAAVLVISIASLVDIQGIKMSGKAMRLTPKCYNPHSECAAGNIDIDRPSTPPETIDGATSFLYLVASDAQLPWYDGESPYIGSLPFP